jgi:Na+-transporting NADH:ubiquinone oxidoreductase subunit NqrC
MFNKKIFFLVIVIVLLVASILVGVKYFYDYKNKVEIARITNKNILTFERMFIEKVLNATGEVSYEDRLELESAVADINDEDFTSQWQAFLLSTTEIEAQQNTIALLKMFTEKIID